MLSFDDTVVVYWRNAEVIQHSFFFGRLRPLGRNALLSSANSDYQTELRAHNLSQRLIKCAIISYLSYLFLSFDGTGLVYSSIGCSDEKRCFSYRRAYL